MKEVPPVPLVLLREAQVQAEASAHGKSIFDFNPVCIGAKDYAHLVDEVIQLTRPEMSLLGPALRSSEVAE